MDLNNKMMIKFTSEEICHMLDIDETKVLNIYPYGSRVYGCYNNFSDYDYIIIYKSSLLPSGSFKDNAITSKNGLMQATCYSRGGFIDAINNYQMPALEAIFLPEEMIVKKTFDFKLNKFEEKQFIKKVISLSSSSWRNSTLAFQNDNQFYTAKNIYHSLRILNFGLQIKKNKKIINYSSMNETKKEIYDNLENINPKDWNKKFIEMSNELKEEDILLIKNETDNHEM